MDGAGVDGAGVGVLLHPAQAEAIVSALDKVPTTVPADDLRVAEQELVELGRTHGPLDLRKAGRLVRDRLDTDGPEPDEQKAYDRESLTLKNADNGVDFRGYLANENAELFRTLIHTHAKPHKTIDGALDPRPRTKRQADALTTLLTTANNPTAQLPATTRPPPCAPRTEPPRHSTERPPPRRGMPHQRGTSAQPAPARARPATPHRTHGSRSAGSLPRRRQGTADGFIPGHGPKPHITVTIDFNDLKAATADKIGHLIYGDGLSAATIRRLACDAQILPIVLGSDSQPLDVGTTVRLATGPIRKALIARDKGCVCCGAPPLYCDAHHVKSWIDGGETKITNLVLLCKRCHRDLHAGHWNIHITNGIVHVTRPTWATPDPIPHDRYRPPTTTPHPTTPHPLRPHRAQPRTGSPRPGTPHRSSHTRHSHARLAPTRHHHTQRNHARLAPTGHHHVRSGRRGHLRRARARLATRDRPALDHPRGHRTPQPLGRRALTSGPLAGRRPHPAVTSIPGESIPRAASPPRPRNLPTPAPNRLMPAPVRLMPASTRGGTPHS